MSNYPCKDCIVKGLCRTSCYRCKLDVHSFMLNNLVCMDCGCTEYYENIYEALYYMVCVDCLSTYFISDNKQRGFIFRSQTSKSTYKHINDTTGNFHPKRLFTEYYDSWDKWHGGKWKDDLGDSR